MLIYSLKYPNKESGKILKNEAAEPHLEPCQISIIGCFCKNTTAKSFIIDVWYGCKYTTAKMLEKTVHFLNVDFAEDTSMSGYPKISEVAVRTCTTT